MTKKEQVSNTHFDVGFVKKIVVIDVISRSKIKIANMKCGEYGIVGKLSFKGEMILRKITCRRHVYHGYKVHGGSRIYIKFSTCLL